MLDNTWLISFSSSDDCVLVDGCKAIKELDLIKKGSKTVKRCVALGVEICLLKLVSYTGHH